MEVQTRVKEKWSKKKKWIFISVGLVLISALICIGIFFLVKEFSDNETRENGSPSQFVMSEDMVLAEGTTSIGIISEEFEPDYLETELYIDEVYVSAEDEIQEGDQILKISEESIEEAREELEAEAETADLAYRAGLIEYEQEKITSKYDYDITLLESQQAKQVYEETISDLKEELESAKEAVAESEELVAEYTNAIENNTFAADYEIEEKEAIYNENLLVLQTKAEEWGIPFAEATLKSSNPAYDRWELLTLQLLYSELEENLKDWNEAEENYEYMVENASLLLEIEKLNLNSLTVQLYETQENYEIKVIEAETTYQTALAKNELVESDYEAALSKAEEDFTELEDAKEDADENLEEFERLIGDGYFYASSSGTILSVLVSEERTLSGDSVVVMYSNPEILTISVDVDQADISKLDIGEEAYVVIDGIGEYTGIIEEINPISTSTSRTSITYEVTVSLEEVDENLDANLVAEVYFNIGEVTE